MPCREDQILNPATGRCVLREGAIGRKLLGKSPSRRSPSKSGSKEYHCPIPGCKFTSETQKGLINHMKTHNKVGRYAEELVCVYELDIGHKKKEDLNKLPRDYIKNNAPKFIHDVLEYTGSADAKLIKVDGNLLTFSFKSDQPYGVLKKYMNEVLTDHEPWYVDEEDDKFFNGGRVLFLGSELGGKNMIEA